MKRITFTAIYGDVERLVEINPVFGAMEPMCHLKVDHFHFGCFVIRKGKWVLMYNGNPRRQDPWKIKTTDDVMILEDIINGRAKSLLFKKLRDRIKRRKRRKPR